VRKLIFVGLLRAAIYRLDRRVRLDPSERANLMLRRRSVASTAEVRRTPT
jgi:hypothetical protein